MEAEIAQQAGKKQMVGPVADSPGLLLSVPAAGEFLGLTTWQVRGLIADKRLPIVRVGRKHYLRRAALIRWAEGAERWQR